MTVRRPSIFFINRRTRRRRCRESSTRSAFVCSSFHRRSIYLWWRASRRSSARNDASARYASHVVPGHRPCCSRYSHPARTTPQGELARTATSSSENPLVDWLRAHVAPSSRTMHCAPCYHSSADSTCTKCTRSCSRSMATSFANMGSWNFCLGLPTSTDGGASWITTPLWSDPVRLVYAPKHAWWLCHPYNFSVPNPLERGIKSELAHKWA